MSATKFIYNSNPLIDLSGDSVKASDLILGTTAHDASGALITGTYDPFPELVITPPIKTTYQVGEQLDLTGIAVTGVTNEGFSKVITNECTFSPADGTVLTPTDQLVDVAYSFLSETLHATQNIYVAYVDHIYVATPPTKVSYMAGDELDLTGIVVKAVWGDGTEEDITSQCVFSPADGTVLQEGDNNVVISWTWSLTGRTFTTNQMIATLVIYQWTDGTDEQVAYMLEKHYAGEIDLHNYWNVGDVRTISIDAIDSRALGSRISVTAQPAQTIQLIITAVGGKTLTNPINGHTECAFQVDLVTPLSATTAISEVKETTSWTNTHQQNFRAWCNENFLNSFPSTLKPIFKQVENNYADFSPRECVTLTDYFALRCEMELWGTIRFSLADEGTHIPYYNSYERRNHGGYNYWIRGLRGYTYSNFLRFDKKWDQTASINGDSLLQLVLFGAI